MYKIKYKILLFAVLLLVSSIIVGACSHGSAPTATPIVTPEPTPTPVLNVSADKHDFGNVNQGNTPSKEFTVTNAGGGTLTWEVDDNFESDCFTVSPSPGSSQSGEGKLTVSVKENAPIGNYSEILIINKNTQPTVISLKAVITYNKPSVVTDVQIALSQSPDTSQVIITVSFDKPNRGVEPFEYAVRYKESQEDNFRVTELGSSTRWSQTLNRNGSYTVEIYSIDANGQAGAKHIIKPSSQPTSLKSERTTTDNELSLSWDAPENNGNSEISGYIVEYRTGSGEWENSERERLETDKREVTLDESISAKASRVRVSARTGVGLGSWAELDVWDKPDATVTPTPAPKIPTTDPTPMPVLNVNPDSYDFGTIQQGNTPSKEFTVRNTGGGTLTWKVDDNFTSDCFTVSPSPGSSQSGNGSLTVSAKRDARIGSCEVSIIVNAGNAGTKSIRITVNVAELPVLNVSPSDYDFGNIEQGNTPSKEFTVTNAGGGTLTWEVEDNFESDCFTVSPEPGRSQSGNGALTVTVKRDAPDGSCTDIVTVDAGTAGTKSIRITVNVEGPELDVSPSSHDFGNIQQGNTPSKEFTVTNGGSGTLTWEVDDNFTSDCFTVSPEPGRSQSGNGELTVTVKDDAPDGSCRDSVTVDAGTAGQENIKVMANIKIYRILFYSLRDGNLEIYTMKSDGTDVKRLTNNDVSDEPQAWSPDGSRILFQSYRDGNDWEIYTMNADGTDEKRLTNNDAHDEPVAWSPDGSRILFGSYRDGDNWEIYTMRADGTDIKRLTDNDKYDSPRAWSPDGSRILFTSTRDDDHREIYTVRADGTDVKRLTNNDADDYPVAFAWSPDGSRILFVSTRDDNSEIYTMRTDGSDVKRLTNNNIYDSPEAWSPDGSRILFESYRDGNLEIYTMRADGTDVKRLTNNDADDNPFAWSSDGSRILFYSERDGNREIYTIKVDGTDVKRLTYNDAEDHPAVHSPWSP